MVAIHNYTPIIAIGVSSAPRQQLFNVPPECLCCHFSCAISLKTCPSSRRLSAQHPNGNLARPLRQTDSCLQKAHAGGKKQHGYFSQTEDSDIVSMEEWLLKKPAGFGEENVYDTSLEEKLLEEIKRDKAAQDAALLKRGTKAQGKAEQKKTKAKAEFEIQPGGVEVWIGTLPKKKNIERDLQLAYKNVTGLVHINPSVLGNEKTRDPICKGFGSLFFRNISSAKSFISSFKDEWVCFGNVQKKLSYKIVKESSSTSDIHLSMPEKNFTNVPKLRIREKNAVQSVSFESISARRTDLQQESILQSMFENESPGNGMAEIQSSAGTWNDGDADHGDVELPKTRTESCNSLKTNAETTVTKTAGDINFVDVCDAHNVEVRRDSSTNNAFPPQKHHLHHVSTYSRDSLYEKRAGFLRGDQSTNLMANNTSPQESSVSTLLVTEVRKQEQQSRPLSIHEEKIEVLEKRLLSKIKGARFESEEKVLRQQQKKKRGFKPVKFKPSKQTLGSSLGSASRLKKKERKFITDTLEKYGRQECISKS